MRQTREKTIADDSLWYKDAIIYQLHVKSFSDSNEDGVGDFTGLISKLDYLEALGVTALWLLPFYPSPLKDDGYDIARYFDVHPQYGSLPDFRTFLREAHRRGLRVITELVLNHTSDQHEWFQRARTSPPGSNHRDYYVWSHTDEKYSDARIIFKDFEKSNWTWDPVAKAYFWHRFYSHQPDLNFDNPHVRKSMLKVMDNWFSAGVDGLRLDAVPYLYERENTNCENLPETHAYLRELRKHVDDKYRNRMLLGEANQWPEDAAAYFGSGDECHMAFHFPVMPRLFMAIQMEDRFPVMDILDQTPRIPETCQWGMFLRNHDELTLEMVTDEERDYMYRVYARDRSARINLGIRRRLAPLVMNNRRKIELMNILLFSLPGTPIIYYGDEIGMGDNYYLGDRNGVRTPMQWNADRNAGFSRANPHKLYLPVIIDPDYHYESANVENQERNPTSLLWWMRRMLAMRKRFKAFSRGRLAFPLSDNPKVLVFTRSSDDETLLIVINLSRFSQVVEIDLSDHAGSVPVETFSYNRFPIIKDAPYTLALGFYDYYWFVLEEERDPAAIGAEPAYPELSAKHEWQNILDPRSRESLEKVLPAYLKRSRWFGGKALTLQQVRITETMPFAREGSGSMLTLVEVAYTEGAMETYLLPLAFAVDEKMHLLLDENPKDIIARVRIGDRTGVLYDAVHEEAFRDALLRLISSKKRIRSVTGELTGHPGKKLRLRTGERAASLPTHVLKAEQSNTSILYGSHYFLKLYRKLDEGPNPDTELSRFLTEVAGFSSAPPFAGIIEYRRRGGTEPFVVAQLQGFVPNQGDAWKSTLDTVRQYFERVLAVEGQEEPSAPASLLQISMASIPQLLQDLIGGMYLETAVILGRKTAELHQALGNAHGDPAFEPEPFSMLYQRSLYQSMRTLTRRVMQTLQKNLKKLPENLREDAQKLLGREQDILFQFQKILENRITAMKIRYHGDLHLGQVLNLGKDYMIIDFEGEPARPLSERRLKRSPLKDVAGMIRSFHYAVLSTLNYYGTDGSRQRERLEPWAELWYRCVSGIYLNSYLFTLENASFIPSDRREFDVLLRGFLLEKAVYELGYELNNRPGWIGIPMKGIEQILKK